MKLSDLKMIALGTFVCLANPLRAESPASTYATAKAARIFKINPDLLKNFHIVPKENPILTEILRHENLQKKVKTYHDEHMNWDSSARRRIDPGFLKADHVPTSTPTAELARTMGEGGGEAVWQAIKNNNDTIKSLAKGYHYSFGVPDSNGTATVPAGPTYGLILKDVVVRSDDSSAIGSRYTTTPVYTIGRKPKEQPIQKVDVKDQQVSGLTMPRMNFMADAHAEAIRGGPGMQLDFYQVDRYYQYSLPVRFSGGVQKPTHTVRAPLADCREVTRTYNGALREQETRFNNISGQCSQNQFHLGILHSVGQWFSEWSFIKARDDIRIRATFDRQRPQVVEVWLTNWL